MGGDYHSGRKESMGNLPAQCLRHSRRRRDRLLTGFGAVEAKEAARGKP